MYVVTSYLSCMHFWWNYLQNVWGALGMRKVLLEAEQERAILKCMQLQVTSEVINFFLQRIFIM